ncbi:MAG: dephospho-CoA kinase [Emergencia sp.]
MKVIGLTGGIGTGKSTVTAFLREKNYPVFDADQMAREMTGPGGSALPEIRRVFGDKVFASDGALDRKKLASIVFADQSRKEDLEKITTQKVVSDLKQQIETLRQSQQQGIVFIDAPLLFEAGVDQLCTLVWVICADAEIRINRVMERDGTGREEVLQRMKNQMSDEEKKARAQEIIDNSKGKEALYQQVEALLRKYA